MTELSIVVPVYGCRDCLRQLHRRIVDTVGELTSSFQVVYVDDASVDGAWEVLSELATEDEHVHVMRLSRNFGQDAAITAGLSRSTGAWTVVMDCDLEEPPEAIRDLYRTALSGYSIVRGVRHGGDRSWLRRVLGGAWLRLMMQPEVDVDYGTLSIMSRAVVDSFLSLNDHDREYRLILDWLGFRRTTLEFERQPRPRGRSSYTPRRLLGVALQGMFFRTTALLRVVALIGLAIAFAGLGLAAYDIYYYIAHGGPAGYTSIVVLQLVLVGFVIVSIGVVGLYVARIFEQVRGRPLFIVDAEMGRSVEEADPDPARAATPAGTPAQAGRAPRGPLADRASWR